MVNLELGDITKFEGDAIVNAANSQLRHGAGVAGAISRAAGAGLDRESELLVSRDGPVRTGSAVLTGGHGLGVEWVIHAVGPIYGSQDENHAELLAKAYRSSLDLAREHGVRTIAFPAISTGIYGYPLQEAAEIAVETVREHAGGIEVTFVLFDEEAFRAFEAQLG